jgi:hypothetical protein
LTFAGLTIARSLEEVAGALGEDEVVPIKHAGILR